MNLPAPMPSPPPGPPPGPPPVGPAGAPPAGPVPKPDPQATLPVEALMAVVGIKRFLSEEPDRVSAADQDRAIALPREIRRSVARFLEEDVASQAIPRTDPFDYKWALSALSQDFDLPRLELIASAFRGVDNPLAAESMDMIKRFAAYLHVELPIRTEVTLPKTFNVDPSDAAIARFRRVFDVANDPMVVLRDLELGMLISEQVRHLQALYPALYALMKEKMQFAWGDAMARKKSWRLSNRKNRLIETLFATNTLPPAFTKSLQDNFAIDGQKKNAGPPQNTPNKLASAVQTPTQKVADGQAE